jgi:hypothetical protein
MGCGRSPWTVPQSRGPRKLHSSLDGREAGLPEGIGFAGRHDKPKCRDPHSFSRRIRSNSQYTPPFDAYDAFDAGLFAQCELENYDEAWS